MIDLPGKERIIESVEFWHLGGIRAIPRIRAWCCTGCIGDRHRAEKPKNFWSLFSLFFAASQDRGHNAQASVTMHDGDNP